MENNNDFNENQQYPRIKDVRLSSPWDVTGYVIFHENGRYLASRHGWFTYNPNDEESQGYVFREERALAVVEIAERDNWQYRPMFFYPATWYANTNKVLFEGPRLTLEEFLVQVKHE